MSPLIVLLLLTVACSWGLPIDDPAWQSYKTEYGKVYATSDVERLRYQIWQDNIRDIASHNGAHDAEYKQGINEFTDMSDEEIMSKMIGGFKQIPRTTGNFSRGGQKFVSPPANVKIPDSVNWVEKGYVTPTKSQGNCGSCYAFSATGALEGAWFKKTGKLPSLSEQQILDCSRKYGNHGCSGGWYWLAWRYFKDVGGADSEHAYPYEAKVGKCRFKKEAVAAQVQKYVDLPSEDENALKQAVATVGPVSVAISVQSSLHRYKSGVYYEPSCRKDFWQLNHAVLAVGYGSEGGKDYWLVKNTWGPHWGLEGYFKMSRNRRNNCGIATIPSYPIV